MRLSDGRMALKRMRRRWARLAHRALQSLIQERVQ
jgi:hypothetical protein